MVIFNSVLRQNFLKKQKFIHDCRSFNQDIKKIIKNASHLFTVELLRNKMVWCCHHNQLQCYREDSDLIETGKNTTSALISREPNDYTSFPVGESSIQNPVDTAVDVSPESVVKQLILPCYPTRVTHPPDRYS